MKMSNKILALGVSGLFVTALALSISMRNITASGDEKNSNSFFKIYSDKMIVGNEKMQSTTISIPKIDTASIHGKFNVTIQPGKENTATVTTDENILPSIDMLSSNNQLKIGIKSGISVTFSKTPTAVITSPTLQHINLNGKNTLDAKNLNLDHLALSTSGNNTAQLQGEIKTLQLTLNGKSDIHANLANENNILLIINGNGKVFLTGTAKQLTINVAGRATVFAKDLIAETVVIQGAGKSEIIVHASKNLSILTAGENNIKYYGNPHVTNNYFGQTTVERMVP